MKNLLTLLLFLTFFTGSLRISAQVMVSGFGGPESVLKFDGKIYVSNIGGAEPNPAARDSNGFISQLSAEGKIIEEKFSKGILNAPKGLAGIGHTLYVADIDRIVGIDTRSGETVSVIKIKGSAFLNDLCRVDKQTLAVSESLLNRVFLVDIKSKAVRLAGHAEGPNGLAFDERTKSLLLCTMGPNFDGTGKIYAKRLYSMDTVFIELPQSPTGLFDGIEMIDGNHLLVSDWINMDPMNKQGRLVIYDLQTHTTESITVDAGPADLSFDPATQTVYLPYMLKNQVLIAKLSAFTKL